MALLLSLNQGNATLTCSSTACNPTLLSLTACKTNSPNGPTCLVRIFREKIWPSPFTSDISIWCDAGAASWGATMENQNLQAQGFFPPELWHGTSSSTMREMWGLFHSLESFLDINRHKSVQIFTDNSNEVRVMGQGSTDLRLNDIVLRIISLTTPHMTFPCFPHGSHVNRTRLPMALLTMKTLVTGL